MSRKKVPLFELIFWKNQFVEFIQSSLDLKRGKLNLNFEVPFIKFEQFVGKISNKTYFFHFSEIVIFLTNNRKKKKMAFFVYIKKIRLY